MAGGGALAKGIFVVVGKFFKESAVELRAPFRGLSLGVMTSLSPARAAVRCPAGASAMKCASGHRTPSAAKTASLTVSDYLPPTARRTPEEGSLAARKRLKTQPETPSNTADAHATATNAEKATTCMRNS
jgi:hypothetical protein